MDNLINKEVEKVAKRTDFDRVLGQDFRHRLDLGSLIRDENPEDHFCSFVVPIDRKSKKIFLGHHIKANDWIPPGGHIEKDETPIQAAVREAQEELGISISEKLLEVYMLDCLDVSAPDKICKIHWHIWYLFETQEINYKFDPGEFYSAGWFTKKEMLIKTRIPQYRDTLMKLI